ncbi:MAG: electron transfer flavoprotein subunit beta/FixA family protein [Anaerolineaceae bacterium]|nr:electron transfer flavoprotein subunit beta/FixA family protein [Anaerolineaceae bacterium]MBN2676465.1 electron transfer flavoprotein subunit beta/FixA family protein [Anaerolineaceae bacterium]
MPEFHMVVCVKVVPRSDEIRVDRETRLLDRRHARLELNPPDMSALEMALNTRDRYGGKLDILSMGPLSFEPLLRVGLAMGCDHIVLLSDRAFGGADTLATTYTLAKGIEKMGGADLIFCGEESADGATGQVPAGLAEWLNVSQLTLLTELSLDLDKQTATGRRSLKGGYEILETPLPCVVSVKNASQEPRFINFSRKAWAYETERVTVWNAVDLNADPESIGLTGSPTTVSELARVPVRERKRIKLEGEAMAKAEQLAVIIRDSL